MTPLTHFRLIQRVVIFCSRPPIPHRRVRSPKRPSVFGRGLPPVAVPEAHSSQQMREHEARTSSSEAIGEFLFLTIGL